MYLSTSNFLEERQICKHRDLLCLDHHYSPMAYHSAQGAEHTFVEWTIKLFPFVSLSGFYCWGMTDSLTLSPFFGEIGDSCFRCVGKENKAQKLFHDVAYNCSSRIRFLTSPLQMAKTTKSTHVTVSMSPTGLWCPPGEGLRSVHLGVCSMHGTVPGLWRRFYQHLLNNLCCFFASALAPHAASWLLDLTH